MKVILFSYAPQAIILGGSIVSAFHFFKDTMKDAMQDFPYKILLDNVKIITSYLKDASLLGASALFEKQYLPISIINNRHYID